MKIKSLCTFTTMNHLEKLNLIDFDYDLPDNRIAYTPSLNRSDSKLLVWNQEIIADSQYENITDFIPPNSLLLFNNSKVIAARILFEKYTDKPLKGFDDGNAIQQKPTVIELFCLEPSSEYQPVQLAMGAIQKVQWICLVGGAKKWKSEFLEKKIWYQNKWIHFFAKKLNSLDGKFLIEFNWDDDSITFSEILSIIGQIPLPPYIERKVTEEDKLRYQTTYASQEGSVAAPTAGLHFSKELLKKMEAHPTHAQFVTLHVGAGTFMPVKTAVINDHPMHAEFIEVDKKTIQYFIDDNEQLIVVGTTSLRTIESIYWLGVKLFKHPNIQVEDLQLLQWDAYTLSETNISKSNALNALIQWMEKNNIETLLSKTQLMILPGYSFKMASGLITNFHQPKSTLLLIIAAIVGKQWKQVYQHALNNQYRFLSYGDGCLFWIPK